MALAYPGIVAAGEALAYGFQAIALSVPAIGLAITHPWTHHHHSDAQATPHSSRRDITDVPDDVPEAVPELTYRFNGQHISATNEVGNLDREKRYIAHSFQQWAMHVYGQRYKFLTGVLLAVARRRYRKWRLHGSDAQHTPLHRQIREEVMRPFDSPPRKRRHYSRAQLYAL